MVAGKRFNITEILNQRSMEQAQQAEPEQKQGTEENEIMMIDVYDLIPSKDNFYHVDDDLKRSIGLVGILQPLLVKRPENGKYRVLAGHRRRLAAIALTEEGKEEYRYVPCVFKKADLRDRLAIIMANSFREKTDWEKMIETIEAEEMARELKGEYQLEGRTRDVLSEITGVSAAQLGRYKAIYNNLNEVLMGEFKADNIGFSVVSELCGLPEEWQQRAATRFLETGSLTLPEVKELKKQEEAARGVPGQLELKGIEEGAGEDKEELHEQEDGQEQDGDTLEGKMNQPEYEDPKPETVISLCYSCENYESCHEKRSTVKECYAYINREEARKTDEQRYNEEQAKIDRETKKKLAEQQEKEEKEKLPEETEQKRHEITISQKMYGEIAEGKLEFLLVKRDGYKLGEEVTLPEFKDGKGTGRQIEISVKYICDDRTGIEDDYCILGFDITTYDA